MAVAAQTISASTLSQKLSPGAGAIIGLVGVDSLETFPLGTGVTADTPMEAGSLTKLFTGLLTAEAALGGQLALSTRLDELLFEEQWPGEPITVEHLATHTSGLPRLSISPLDIVLHRQDPYRSYGRKELLAWLRSHEPVVQNPVFAYSNFGYAVLGAMLERATGQSYEHLLQTRILDPLRMSASGLHLTGRPDRTACGRRADGSSTSVWHFDAYAPCGALVTTLTDLATAAQAFLDLSYPLAQALAFALEPRAEMPGHNVGLAWLTSKDARWSWHNGATFGYTSYLGLNRASSSPVVILSNQFLAADATALGHQLMRLT